MTPKTKITLTEQQLINIAKQECEKEGWQWLEPINITTVRILVAEYQLVAMTAFWNLRD